MTSVVGILLFLTFASGYKWEKVEKQQGKKVRSKYEKVHFSINSLSHTQYTPPLSHPHFHTMMGADLKTNSGVETTSLTRGVLDLEMPYRDG